MNETAELISSANEEGAEVVVLPEMWPTGYGEINYRELSAPIPGLYTDFLSENAVRHRIHIIAGMPESGDGNDIYNIYNSSVLIDDKGRVIGKHRKIHLYPSVGEDQIWKAGNDFTVIDTRMGRVGLLTCYDGDFPECWRANALMGAEIVIQINAYESPYEDWWNKFYPSAALQNTVWVVQCNAVGDTMVGKPVHFFGHSRIIAPDGRIEAEAPYVASHEQAESFVLVRTIELRKRFEEARRLYGNLLKDRRPEAYGTLVKKA